MSDAFHVQGGQKKYKKKQRNEGENELISVKYLMPNFAPLSRFRSQTKHNKNKKGLLWHSIFFLYFFFNAIQLEFNFCWLWSEVETASDKYRYTKKTRLLALYHFIFFHFCFVRLSKQEFIRICHFILMRITFNGFNARQLHRRQQSHWMWIDSLRKYCIPFSVHDGYKSP